MFFTNKLYSVGEYLPIKVFKGYMFFLTNVIFLILLTNLQNKLTEKKIFYPFFITFIILFIVLIIEKINPNLLSIFHNNVFYHEQYGRIRLLTSEASFTSTLIILNFVLAFFYSSYIKKKKIYSFMLICMLIIFIIEGSSKGLLSALFISLMICVLSNKKIHKKYIIGMIFILIIFAIIFLPTLINSFEQDISKYTSTVTRIYCIINAIILSIMYPFGLGNGLYLPMYIEILTNKLSILKKISFNINTNEVYNIVNSTNDSVIGAKSGIFQYAIYWGIIGTIYFMKFLYDLYKDLRKIKKTNNVVLQLGLLYLVISIIFFVDFDYKYEIFSYISVIISYIKINLN